MKRHTDDLHRACAVQCSPGQRSRPLGVPQVECDGRELALPRDTEGLIIMNIPSYMGGVDLWASGRPAPPAITAAGFTDAGPQSMSDQRLEVRCCSLWKGFTTWKCTSGSGC